MTDMFPHQIAGAMRIADRQPTYLGYDMGIGKTRTFIEAVKLRKAKRVLVICPASAVLVWKREIGLWDIVGPPPVVVRGPGDLNKPATYYIVSHGLMSQRDGVIPLALWTGALFEMTAIDEAHAFNAADTNRVKALRRACFQARPDRAAVGHADEEPCRRSLHPAQHLLAAGLQDVPPRIRREVLPRHPQDLRGLAHDPGDRGLEEPRRAEEADRAVHVPGPQGGRVQGPARDQLGSGPHTVGSQHDVRGGPSEIRNRSQEFQSPPI